MNIKDLKFDDKNANKHTEKGLRLVEKSISKCGMGRSILIDKDNNIIAGNGVTETAGQLGIDKVRIIETDGNEIIAVKRTDVTLSSKKGRELAIADNQTAKAGIDFDFDVIDNISEEIGLNLINEWELFDKDGSFAKAYESDKGEADFVLPFPITIVVTEEDYNEWVELKERLKIHNDKEAFFKIIREGL